jgi:hypothetical protein
MSRGEIFVTLAAVAVAACGGSSNNGFSPIPDGGSGGGDATGAAGDGSGIFSNDGGVVFDNDGGTTNPQDGAALQPVAVVYAQSADTLYRLDPNTTQITVVAPFSGGCSSIIDIAVDSSSNGYVTTSNALWSVNLKTAVCTHISDGSYPNSLSFVPKGTLDPNVEAMVGYNGSTYIRISTTTGAVTNVGGLTKGYTSSGDIVSVIGGGTFLTVKGGPENCADCLLQIDPKTGNLIQDYGPLGYRDVFGLAFWAGTAYGFDNGGDVFSISSKSGKIATNAITVPNAPPNLSFWGAGSTTSAPATSADGGGIPITQ